MTTHKKPYHHGDLRHTLLATAIDLISQGGVENLSIRKLADQVGVSRTAPYHHFKDKNELLCAIAEQGFETQNRILQRAIDRTHVRPDATAQHSNSAQNRTRDSTALVFEDYVMAYLRFTDEQRETYDLMYGREIWRTGTPTPALQTISKNSFHTWRNWIEHLHNTGLFDANESPRRIAQAHWAALHGLCRLFNDGVYVNRDDRNEIARTMLKAMMRR